MLKYYCFLIISMLIISPTIMLGQKPRIIISTDIGGTDPDDNQSMTHLLMYSDLFDIEGLISTPSYGAGSKEEILHMIDLYEKDYPQLKQRYNSVSSPNELRSITKQGRRGEAPIYGYDTTTEGSDWIIKCAHSNDKRPLWVLVWGALEDVAQALHDSPDIASKIRVYWIGGPNKKWGCNAYNYIASNFPNLWFIECNASYRGFIGSASDKGTYGASFWQNFMKGHGVLGDNYINYYKGITKAGDTPSLLYLMGKDENGKPFDSDDPTKQHWGGQFEKMSQSPKYIISVSRSKFQDSSPKVIGSLCEQDTVPVYSIMEWHLKGPKLEKLPSHLRGGAGGEAFTLLVDKQTWKGHYVGNGEYIVRYAPKAPATLKYVISSPIEGFHSHEGVFVAGEKWPAIDSSKFQVPGFKSKCIKPVPMKLGKTWWTDLSDEKMLSGVSDDTAQGGGDYSKQNGKWQGAGTIAKWRDAIMQDWATRFSYLR